MHPRYLWCVAPKQDAAPSRARRGRWGGGLFARTHAARWPARLAPLPLSAESRYAHCGSVYLCFLTWGGGGEYTWFVPPTWPLGLYFALQLFILLHWLC